MSGATCETVANTGTDVSVFELYAPVGGVNVENCKYLLHLSVTETTAVNDAMAFQNFFVYTG